MKNKLEPLLKEEVETFPFLEEENKKNKSKSGHSKMSLDKIITIILAIFTILWVGRTAFTYYIGFKYFDLRLEESKTTDNNNDEPSKDNNPSNNTEPENISLNSPVVNNTYTKMTLDGTNSLLSKFYSPEGVTKDGLSSEEKMSLVFNNLGINCNNQVGNTNLDEIRRIEFNLFGDNSASSMLENFEELNVGDFTLTNNAGEISVNLNSCNANGIEITRELVDVASNADELYIYETFAYIVPNSDGSKSVFASANQDNLVFTVGATESLDLSNQELPRYRWTYKKSSDDNYYFESIIKE